MVDIASLAIQIDTSDVARAERDLDKLSNKGAKSERAAKGVGDAHDKATGKVGALGTSARKTGDALDKGARSAGAYAGKIAAMAAPLLSVAAAMAAINKVSDVQRQFDVLNAGLVTATGSAKNAQVAFSALQDFARQTPYDLAQTVEGFTKLVNLGLTPSEKALRSYGNTASALGKDLNQMIEAVADASTGEFERLKEFGIKAKQNGDQVSLTFQGVTKSIGNNAAEIEKYLTDLGENQFAGAMTQRMATLDGAISNLGDSWDAFALNISNAGAGDLMEGAVRQAIDALDELNAQLESGQLEAQLGAISGKFDGWGGDIAQTLDIVGDIFESATGRWGALVDSNVENMTSTFANFPENVRAFIQLMTVEVLNGFDKVTAYSAAFKDGIKAIFTDDTMEGVGARLEADLQRLNELRDDSIASILEERDAALTSYSDQMAAAQDLRKVYDEALERSAKSTEDRLAKFKALGDSAGTASEGVAKLGKKLKELKQLDATGPGDAINDYIKQFEKLHDELNPAEVAAREYGKQQDLLNDIIARGGENADKARGDLAKLREQYEENNQATSEWAKWTESALERVDSAFADAWRNIGDGFDSFRDSLTNAFKQMLAELAHMAITRPIVLQIGAAMGIGGGSGGILSSLGGSGGGGGFSLSNLLSYAQTGYSLMTGVGPAALAGYQSGGIMGGLQGAAGYYGNLASSAWGTVSGWFGGSAAAGAGSAAGTGFGLGQSVVSGQIGNAAYAGAQAGVGGNLSGMLGNLGAIVGPIAGLYMAIKGYGAISDGYDFKPKDFDDEFAGVRLGAKVINAYENGITKVFGDSSFLSKALRIPVATIGGLMSSVFGGGWETKNYGLAFSVANGDFLGQSYEDQKKKGGWFSSSKKRTRFSALDEETAAQFQSVYDATEDTVAGLFESLSYSVEEASFDGLQLARTKISTKGKTEEEIQQAIAEWFGSAADAMTAELNKVFATGLDLDFEGMQAFVGNLQGVNEVLRYLDVGMYDASVAGGKLAEALSAAAGGLDALATNSATYYGAFFSEAEKIEDTIDSIKRAFESADVELVSSREAYRAMVEDIDLTTEAGQKMFATMMALSGQAAQYYSIVEQQAAAAAAQALANTQLYYEQFTTAGQKTEDVLAGVVAQFEDLELALPGTRDGFIAAVDALDTTTEAGKKMFDTLMGVAGAADAYYDILEQRASQAVGNAYSLLERSVNAEKAALTTAYQQQKAEQDALLQQRREMQQQYHQALSNSYRDMAQTASATASALSGLSSAISSALGQLVDDSAEVVEQRRDAAVAQLRRALTTGDLSNADQLAEAARTAASVDAGVFGSLEDFRREQGRTANLLAELGDLTTSRQTAAEQQAESLQKLADQSASNAQSFSQSIGSVKTSIDYAYEAELAALDEQLALGKSQIDALNGIDNSVVSVADAVSGLTAAITAAMQQIPGLSSVTVPGFAAGGSFAGGLRLVGERGPELEVTGPSRIYNASQTAAMLGGGAETAAEVRALRQETVELRAYLYQIAKNTGQTASGIRRQNEIGIPEAV